MIVGNFEVPVPVRVERISNAMTNSSGHAQTASTDCSASASPFVGQIEFDSRHVTANALAAQMSPRAAPHDGILDAASG
jgi:hypothetical protein